MRRKRATKKQLKARERVRQSNRETLVDTEAKEAVEIVMSGDAMSAEELDNLPALKGVSLQSQGVICMAACGYTFTDIAASYGITRQYASAIVQRYDPNGMYRLSPKAKKAFISKLAEAKGIAALSSITLADINECSAPEKMKIAKMGMDISAQLSQSKHKSTDASAIDSLLEAVEKERVAKVGEQAEDAEFEVVDSEEKR